MNLPRREIRFAVAAQFPPFQSRDQHGRLVGLNIELGNALCEQLNARCIWVDQTSSRASQPLKPGNSTRSWAWRRPLSGASG